MLFRAKKHMTRFADALGQRLNELTQRNEQRIGEMRTTLEGRLKELQVDNAQKLEQMRATEDDVDNITRAINPGLFAHHPGHPISQENMNDIVDRRNNFASIHNWEGLK